MSGICALGMILLLLPGEKTNPLQCKELRVACVLISLSQFISTAGAAADYQARHYWLDKQPNGRDLGFSLQTQVMSECCDLKCCDLVTILTRFLFAAKWNVLYDEGDLNSHLQCSGYCELFTTLT